ncbi:MAG: hypothetical protein LBD84_02020 [Campylobacteraceae bacterium]|jgi:hypothetical protein|nr:hypothetical protein [Campylobacteraceae bacterium]
MSIVRTLKVFLLIISGISLPLFEQNVNTAKTLKHECDKVKFYYWATLKIQYLLQ